MVTAEEEQRLSQLNWAGIESSLEGVSTVVFTSLSDGLRVRRLARRSDGACVYLGSDQLCHLHRHFGPQAKPLACQLYPFGFSTLADRVMVDCAFSCRSISQGGGDALQSRFVEWDAILEKNPEERDHRLTQQRELPGPVLWEFEQYLIGFLRDQNMSLFDRVRCCLQFVRLATTGDPTTDAAMKLRSAISRGLPRQILQMPRGGEMDRTQRMFFYYWLFVVLNPAPVDLDLLSGPERQRAEDHRRKAGKNFADREGAPLIDNRKLDVTWEQIHAVDVSVVTASASPLLERFLVAKIIGQRFLLAGRSELPLVEALPLFLLSYPMAIWTARAFAAQRGGSVCSEEDLRRALSLLDRSLGQTSIAALSKREAKAWRFIVEDVDLAVEATNELVGWREDSGNSKLP